jgi:hypothetical protein
MSDNFNKFLDYLEPKVAAFGSVRLSVAIEEFWKISAATTAAVTDQIAGKLNATGKYVVQPGEISGSAQIRHNPNYEINESIRKTNRVQRLALMLTVCVSLLTLVSAIVSMEYQSQRLDLERQQKLLPVIPPADTSSVVVRRPW